MHTHASDATVPSLIKMFGWLSLTKPVTISSKVLFPLEFKWKTTWATSNAISLPARVALGINIVEKSPPKESRENVCCRTWKLLNRIVALHTKRDTSRKGEWEHEISWWDYRSREWIMDMYLHVYSVSKSGEGMRKKTEIESQDVA